jgi:cytochrome oxidase assembly protein ShyY1
VFFGPWQEAAGLAVVEDRVDHLFGLVDHLDQVHVVGVIMPSLTSVVLNQSSRPFQKADSDEDHRDLAALAGLDQGHRLEELVQRAKPPGITT